MAAFYTKNTPYEREARKLKKTCAKFDIPYDIVGIEAKSSWEENCSQKPRIIREAMDRHPDLNIVYLDSDARIMQDPVLFDDFPADLGVHYLNGQELLSGTIYLGNNRRTYNLVCLWDEIQKQAGGTWDQVVLQDTIRVFGASFGIKLRTLPGTYCQIHDIMAHAGKPVIKHTQASRVLKEVVRQ